MSQFFFEILDLNFATGSVENILGNDSRTGILTNRDLRMGSQVSQLSFQAAFRKIK